MNTVIETIYNRRSVRSYTERKLTESELTEIISCGNAAPSGAANRNWRFVVVESENFRKKLAELAEQRQVKWVASMPEEAREKLESIKASTGASLLDSVYYGAPVIVFVIGWGQTCDFDTPMVCQNMMIAARSMEIGSCWVYAGQLVLDDKEVRSIFKLKEGEKVFGPIILGYPLKEFPKNPEIKKADILRF